MIFAWKILFNPNGEFIDSQSQLKAIQKLREVNTLQRVGVEEYNSYYPKLDDGIYVGWDLTNDTHSTTDLYGNTTYLGIVTEQLIIKSMKY